MSSGITINGEDSAAVTAVSDSPEPVIDVESRVNFMSWGSPELSSFMGWICLIVAGGGDVVAEWGGGGLGWVGEGVGSHIGDGGRGGRVFWRHDIFEKGESCRGLLSCFLDLVGEWVGLFVVCLDLDLWTDLRFIRSRLVECRRRGVCLLVFF